MLSRDLRDARLGMRGRNLAGGYAASAYRDDTSFSLETRNILYSVNPFVRDIHLCAQPCFAKGQKGALMRMLKNLAGCALPESLSRPPPPPPRRGTSRCLQMNIFSAECYLVRATLFDRNFQLLTSINFVTRRKSKRQLHYARD